MISMIKQTKLQGVYETFYGKRRFFATKSFAPGTNVYGEIVMHEDGEEYRLWDVMRSKLCAFMVKDADQIAIRQGSTVLYLGASSGTTVSHVSDIVGETGFVFAVDFAPRMLRDLVFVAEKRSNIGPIMGDANKPEEYLTLVSEVDVVYQDVAQRNQFEIFVKNCDLFLKPKGFGLLAIKARSMDVTKKPQMLFNEVREQLEKKFTIVDKRILDPFQKDHIMFLVKKK